MSPVYVKDIAAIIAQSLEKKETIGQIYELGGPENLDWKTIIKVIGRAVGKNKWAVPTPAFGIKLVAALFDRFAFFPITREQITMLMEGNCCDSKDIFELFGMKPTCFDKKFLSYLLAV